MIGPDEFAMLKHLAEIHGVTMTGTVRMMIRVLFADICPDTELLDKQGRTIKPSPLIYYRNKNLPRLDGVPKVDLSEDVIHRTDLICPRCARTISELEDKAQDIFPPEDVAKMYCSQCKQLGAHTVLWLLPDAEAPSLPSPTSEPVAAEPAAPAPPASPKDERIVSIVHESDQFRHELACGHFVWLPRPEERPTWPCEACTGNEPKPTP